MGRFAPTPSGDLHFGSLIAALASAADAKSQQGLHRVRIDDIDPPRVVTGSIERIQQAIHHYALPIDGEIRFQSESNPEYRKALQALIDQELVFACRCSRKSLAGNSSCTAACSKERFSHSSDIEDQLKAINGEASLRLALQDATISTPFVVRDSIQAPQHLNDFEQLGTPVLWRKDGYVSYLLATAVDDSAEITDVVRGADLWPETVNQQIVMQLLNRELPSWAHVPLAVDDEGHKLGKQTRAESIHDRDPLDTLQKAWNFLGQPNIECGTLNEFWLQAAELWSRDAVPKVATLPLS